jgi:hypoxanthine phosphoribosyltransferase
LGRAKPVMTLTPEGLSTRSRELWTRIHTQGFEPHAVVGIAEGGARVVEAMRLPDHLPVFTCTLRRPSTERKRAHTGSLSVLRRLPYGVSDRIRQIEDLTLRLRSQPTREPSPTLVASVREIVDSVTQNGLRRVVVVDDALDSGSTMACVMALLRQGLPREADVRSAVLTVTRDRSQLLIQPDFSLYERVLVRFPWSLDYLGNP